MSRPIRILISVAVLGLACSAGALVMILINRPAEQNEVGAQPVPVEDYGLRILPFKLTDHTGTPGDESLLRGQWTLVSFMFTNCPGACPVMTARMVEAASLLPESPVRFAGFSLDMTRDTPEQLRSFAASHSVDLERWTLLTGDDAQVRRMVEEGLKLVVDSETTGPITLADGTTMKNITHPTRIFLVGPDLRVMEMFDSGNPAEVARMVETINMYTQGQ